MVIIRPLSVIVLTAKGRVTCMTALCQVVSVFVRRAMNDFRIPLVIASKDQYFVIRRRASALKVDVFVRVLSIGVKVEDRRVRGVVLKVARPIFPAHVPALRRCLIGAIFNDGICMLLRVDHINQVGTIQFRLKVIHVVRFREERIGDVYPKLSPYGRFPPCTSVFRQLGPKNVVVLAELVRVRGRVKNRCLTDVVASCSHAPKDVTKELRVPFVSLDVQDRPKFGGRILIVRIRVRTEMICRNYLIRIGMRSVDYFGLCKDLSAHQQGSDL